MTEENVRDKHIRKGFCKKRTTRQKSLLLLTCVLVASVIILLCVMLIQVEPQTELNPSANQSTDKATLELEVDNIVIRNEQIGSYLEPHKLKNATEELLMELDATTSPTVSNRKTELPRPASLQFTVQPTTQPMTENNVDSVCMTAHCESISAAMMSAMNTSVDPCQDFYQYACGRWNHTNPISKENSDCWDVFARLQQDHQITLQTLLGTYSCVCFCILVIVFLCVIDVAAEQPAEYFTSDSEKRAQRYYQSCVDVNKTKESLGGKPLLELLELIGG